MEEKRYIIYYECRNCYHWTSVSIPYGTEKPNYLLCPNCGIDDMKPVKKMPDNFDFHINGRELEHFKDL